MTNDKTLAKTFCYLVSHTPKKRIKNKKRSIAKLFVRYIQMHNALSKVTKRD